MRSEVVSQCLAGDMIKGVLITLFLLPGLAHGVICKSVDAGGVVSYADVPREECRTRVKLPEYSRYKPRPVERQDEASGVSETAATKPRFEGYQSIRIVKPSDGEAVRGDSGKVSLALLLEPALQPGHRIGIFLNNVLVPGTFDGLDIELTGVDAGSHKLRAVVMDADGKRIVNSDAVGFTMLQPQPVDAAPVPAESPQPGSG